MTGFSIVSTTVASEAEARALARALVEARLAACVQVLPIESTYRWEGNVETAREQLLLCKIATADFAAMEAAIRSGHAYHVPEIVMTPIEPALPLISTGWRARRGGSRDVPGKTKVPGNTKRRR